MAKRHQLAVQPVCLFQLFKHSFQTAILFKAQAIFKSSRTNKVLCIICLTVWMRLWKRQERLALHNLPEPSCQHPENSIFNWFWNFIGSHSQSAFFIQNSWSVREQQMFQWKLKHRRETASRSEERMERMAAASKISLNVVMVVVLWSE